eukprot:3161904-Rhodomonas_salina.4
MTRTTFPLLTRSAGTTIRGLSTAHAVARWYKHTRAQAAAVASEVRAIAGSALVAPYPPSVPRRLPVAHTLSRTARPLPHTRTLLRAHTSVLLCAAARAVLGTGMPRVRGHTWLRQLRRWAAALPPMLAVSDARGEVGEGGSLALLAVQLAVGERAGELLGAGTRERAPRLRKRDMRIACAVGARSTHTSPIRARQGSSGEKGESTGVPKGGKGRHEGERGGLAEG